MRKNAEEDRVILGIDAAVRYIAQAIKGEKKRSTDNNSGKLDSEIVLPQTVRNAKRAEVINAILRRSHGITRRKARKIAQKVWR